MECFNKDLVKDFPLEPGVSALKIRDKIYAVRYEKDAESKRKRRVYLGVVVDNDYYPMDKYKALFLKSGAKREMPVGAIAVKPQKAPRSNYLNEILKDVSNKSSVPKGKYIRAKKDRDSIYIIDVRYFIVDGKRKHITKYLGKIIDGKYYKMDEYRAKFKRARKVSSNTVKEVCHEQ